MRKAPIVMVALIVSIVTALGWSADALVDPLVGTGFGLALLASYYAVGAALVIGLLELGARLRGTAAVGMKIAAASVVCSRVVELVRA